MRVQLLEIYNEQLRDLLDTSRSGKRLDIRNTERSGLNVPDAIQVRAVNPRPHERRSGSSQTYLLLANKHAPQTSGDAKSIIG